MKNKNSIIILVLIMTVCLSAITSCTIWNAKDWKALKDRKFYFQKFTFSSLREEKKTAFKFMETAPIKEMLYIISKKHDLLVDMTEFQYFIESGDYAMLHVTGILQDQNYIWESKKKQVNQIEIEYVIQPETQLSRDLIVYKLLIKNDDKVRAIYLDKVYEIDNILKNFAANLDYGDMSNIEQEIKESKDSKNRLILAADKPRVEINDGDAKSEMVVIIKKQIALYVKGLKPKEKEAFRANLVQFINAICK